MKRKVLAMLMAGAMVIGSLTGCGYSSGGQEDSSTANTADDTAENTGGGGDR